MGWIGLGLLGITIAAGSYFCLKKCKDGNNGSYNLCWLNYSYSKKDGEATIKISIPNKLGENRNIEFLIYQDKLSEIVVKIKKCELEDMDFGFDDKMSDEEKLCSSLIYTYDKIIKDSFHQDYQVSFFNNIEGFIKKVKGDNRKYNRRLLIFQVFTGCILLGSKKNNRDEEKQEVYNIRSLNDINSEKKRTISLN